MWHQSKSLGRPLRKKLQYGFIQRQLKREKEARHGNCIRQITHDCKEMLRRKLEEIELYNSTIPQNRSRRQKCYKCRQRGHIIKNCPMKNKEHNEGTEKPGNISETAKLVNEEFMTTKPTVSLKYLEWIHFATKCMIKGTQGHWDEIWVPKQEHSRVLSMPTEIVEEDKEYTCLTSHQCDVAEIKAPTMETTNRRLPSNSGRSLEYMDVSNNSFEGSLHHFLCSYDGYFPGVLNMGNNHLSRIIPDCWENWKGLEFLNLENNNLSSGYSPETLVIRGDEGREDMYGAILGLVTPKHQGGLGLKDLAIWNKAMIVKHLWYIAMDKKSLWVKWVNTVKLKGKSIWAVNEEINDSWGWKNILRIRDEVRQFMVMKVGNGENTSVIYDNWCNAGALQTFITNRDIYNGRFDVNTVVKEIVSNGICEWPTEWTEKFPCLNLCKEIRLDNNMKDKLVWRSRSGKESMFSVSQAYDELKGREEEVKWANLIWFSQNIPKHSFILWMAILNKLSTQDKIRGWGSYDMMVCSLCNQDADSHQHPFFKCQYADKFWSMAKSKLGINSTDMEWNEFICYASKLYNGNSIQSVIRRLGIAACVYLLWQERNGRIFRSEKRSPNELFEVLCEVIRLRLLSLKFKNSKAVDRAQQQWSDGFLDGRIHELGVVVQGAKKDEPIMGNPVLGLALLGG
ncbi:RNA-directed DNA polymerase, eukaryota, reverse transcriptase zinc-binding domain protein [Tanacetum coccineum]